METQDARDAGGVPEPAAGEVGKDFEAVAGTEAETTNTVRPMDPRGE